MSTKKMTPDEIIEYLKEKGFPASLLDKEAIKSNRKLTPEEQEIFVKYIVDNLRTLEANKYLISCAMRFGPGINEQFSFRHKNIVVDLDLKIIEKLLIVKVESVILEQSNDGVFALFRFYEGNKAKGEEGDKWMQDMLDQLLINSATLLISQGKSQLIH